MCSRWRFARAATQYPSLRFRQWIILRRDWREGLLTATQKARPALGRSPPPWSHAQRFPVMLVPFCNQLRRSQARHGGSRSIRNNLGVHDEAGAVLEGLEWKSIEDSIGGDDQARLMK